MRSFLWKAPLALTVVLAAACQDLDVVNTNAPDRDRALTEPGDVLTLMTAAYGSVHGRTFTSSSSYLAFPLIADEASGTYANGAALEMSSEPRVPYNNNPTSDASGLARYQWEDWYAALADVNDVIGAMDDGLELTIGSGEEAVNYDREARLWGKLIQGWAHSYLGMLIDQGFIYTEEDLGKGVAELELRPYPEMLQAGHDLLHGAIEYAQANPDVTIPVTWFGSYDEPLSSGDIIKMAHLLAARNLVLGARTPEERENTDWAHVMDHLNKTFTSDFIYYMDGTYRHRGLYFAINEGTFVHYCDYKNCGPADTSGGYQEWLSKPWPDRTPFFIVTPDKRFPQDQEWGTNGKYFENEQSTVFRPERGLYHHSYYQFERYPDYRNMDYSYFKLDEINLLKAEAQYFLGNRAQAAQLTNISRVGVGELPPLTADGVPGTPGTCVPMKSTVTPTCADLYGAIMYERRMELYHQDALYGYLDSRGFGRLSDGTPIHLPIPGRELATLGMELYSFGGIGGPGAAVNIR